MVLHFFYCCLSNPPLWGIYDPFQGDIVIWVLDEFQVCDYVLYFLSVVELESPNHLVGKLLSHKCLLEGSGLNVCPVEDCHILELVALIEKVVNFSRYKEGLLL